MKMMKIMRGVSGIGKTQHAIGVKGAPVILSADSFFMIPVPRPEGGIKMLYKFDPHALGKAHSQCVRCCVGAIQSGENIVIDNTNCSLVEIAPYYALGQAYDYDVEIIQIEPNPITFNEGTLKVFADRNKHGVPLETIQSQFRKIGNEGLPPWWNRRIIYV